MCVTGRRVGVVESDRVRMKMPVTSLVKRASPEYGLLFFEQSNVTQKLSAIHVAVGRVRIAWHELCWFSAQHTSVPTTRLPGFSSHPCSPNLNFDMSGQCRPLRVALVPPSSMDDTMMWGTRVDLDVGRGSPCDKSVL